MTLQENQRLTYRSLQENRRYVYVIVLFLCACLTESPNYLSQLQIAIPSIIAFELLILAMAKFKIVIFYNFRA